MISVLLRKRVGRDRPDSAATVRAASPAEIECWDDLVAANPDGGDVWRSHDYAEQKRRARYHPWYLLVNGQAVTVHEKRVPFLGRLWYLPAGPGAVDVEGLIRTVEALAEFARTEGVFAIKVEPRLRFEELDRQRLLDRGFRESATILPNYSTIVLDIAGEPDKVMASFSTRARRWIRRADRDGVVVERVPATDANCRTMHDLLSQTASKRFGIRSYEYNSSSWKRYDASGAGQLFVARFEGEIVAGAFAMRLGPMGMYKDGASVRKQADSSKQSGLGAHGVGHAVQWAIIGWAKDNGCVRYDLGGTPPAAQANDPTHPYHGIGEFKQSFSYDITDYLGAFDLPIRRRAYALWRTVVEREMRRFSMLVRREFYY